MSETLHEETEIHTRIQKVTLQVEDCRAYWAHTDGSGPVDPREAFEGYWFGTRSLPYVQRLLADMKARFAAFPPSLRVLHRWTDMAPDTRRVICHWHLQLADPLYRSFTGYLANRRSTGRQGVSRDLAVRWLSSQAPDRWTMPTQLKIASKLLSAAHSAELLASNRDPRLIVFPSVPDEGLEYFVYLLRNVILDGSLLENPYFASVGLEGLILEDRLRRLPSLDFDRQGDLIQFGWHYENLAEWAEHGLRLREPLQAVGG